jgi:hypothetical protein
VWFLSLLSRSAAVGSCCGARQATGLDTDPLALDMGSFYLDSLSTTVLLAAGGASAATSTATATATATAAALAAELGDARLAAAALPMAHGYSSSSSSPAGLGGGSGGSAGSMGQLVLYSVCPRSLQSRAQAWGSALNLPVGMQQTNAGYFAAPGAVGLQLDWPACRTLVHARTICRSKPEPAFQLVQQLIGCVIGSNIRTSDVVLDAAMLRQAPWLCQLWGVLSCRAPARSSCPQ